MKTKTPDPILHCNCWVQIGHTCGRKATHIVGRTGRRDIPMSMCEQHAKPYKRRPGYSVLSL